MVVNFSWLDRMLTTVRWTKIESEVIIDFTSSFRDPDYAINKPQIGLQGVSIADERELYEDLCPAETDQCLRRSHNGILDDTRFDKLQMDRFLNVDSHGTFLTSRGVPNALNEHQLILLPHRVYGFSLRSRKWGMSIFTINEGSRKLTYYYSPIEY